MSCFLYNAALNCIALCGVESHCIAWYLITLYLVLNCIILHGVASYCIAWQ